MPDHEPLARGPITPPPPLVTVAGWQVSAKSSESDLTITDCSPMAKVLLRGELSGELGVAFGQCARLQVADFPALLVGATPDSWLLLGPPGTAGELSRWRGGTSIDVTHGHVLLRVTGGRVRELLSRECAVDLAASALPNLTAFRSRVSRVDALVVRDDRDEVPSFLIAADWNLGEYLCDALGDAGADLGLETAGFAALCATRPGAAVHPVAAGAVTA